MGKKAGGQQWPAPPAYSGAGLPSIALAKKGFPSPQGEMNRKTIIDYDTENCTLSQAIAPYRTLSHFKK